MKIRLQMRKERTPEEEKARLLKIINTPVSAGRTFLKLLLGISAIILLIAVLAALSSAFHSRLN